MLVSSRGFHEPTTGWCNAVKGIELRNRVFYTIRPLIPRRTQIWLRRWIARRKRQSATAVWPIFEPAGQAPGRWPGWPNHRRFAFIVLHDVESAKGQDRCLRLMRLEEERGFC